MKKYCYIRDIKSLLKTIEFILSKDYYKEIVEISYTLLKSERIEIKCTRSNHIERVMYNKEYLVYFIENNDICTIVNSLYHDLYFYHDLGIIIDNLGARR